MTEIVWQDPPSRNGGGPRGQYAEFFEALRSRPGQWALFPRTFGSAGTATNIKRGIYSGTEAGEFDTTVRKRTDGQYDVFVRCIGDA